MMDMLYSKYFISFCNFLSCTTNVSGIEILKTLFYYLIVFEVFCFYIWIRFFFFSIGRNRWNCNNIVDSLDFIYIFFIYYLKYILKMNSLLFTVLVCQKFLNDFNGNIPIRHCWWFTLFLFLIKINFESWSGYIVTNLHPFSGVV